MAHSVGIEVKCTGIETLKKALGDLVTPDVLKGINREVGLHCQEKTADHIAMASVNHHKSAQRLGAKPTGHFEFAPGRTSSKSRGGGKVGSKGASAQGVTITIGNTPGIMMAFGQQTITPKRAKALTIPIHRAAYGKSAADLKAEGYSLFVPRAKGGGKASYLMATRGNEKFPAYALKRSVNLPHLPDLLPTNDKYAQWSRELIEMEVLKRVQELGLSD